MRNFARERAGIRLELASLELLLARDAYDFVKLKYAARRASFRAMCRAEREVLRAELRQKLCKINLEEIIEFRG